MDILGKTIQEPEIESLEFSENEIERDTFLSNEKSYSGLEEIYEKLKQENDSQLFRIIFPSLVISQAFTALFLIIFKGNNFGYFGIGLSFILWFIVRMIIKSKVKIIHSHAKLHGIKSDEYSLFKNYIVKGIDFKYFKKKVLISSFGLFLPLIMIYALMLLNIPLSAINIFIAFILCIAFSIIIFLPDIKRLDDLKAELKE